ncbi:hypothetical protein ACX0G9_26475 [Flavitalea flava]
MRFLILLSIGLHFSFVISCSPSQKEARAANKRIIKKSFDGRTRIAFYEDSVISIQYTTFRHNVFEYAIVHKGIKKKLSPEFYDGHFRIVGDSIYLDFQKDIRPSYLPEYLIKEMTGQYIIQYFTDGRKRIFLRREMTWHR